MGIEWRQAPEWNVQKLAHGFTGDQYDFSRQGIEQFSSALCAELKVQSLMVVSQVHGGDLVCLPAAMRRDILACDRRSWRLVGEADGIVFEYAHDAPCVFGIRTADCLPVLMKAGSWGAVVHAGWRGLAAGILTKAVKELGSLSNGAPLQALIGPAAGSCCYQVGAEVLEALSPFASYRPDSAASKFLLDLRETAASELESRGCVVCSFNECTICRKGWNSYRIFKTNHHPEKVGTLVNKRHCPSNLSFLVG